MLSSREIAPAADTSPTLGAASPLPLVLAVVEFIQPTLPTFETVLVLISQVYSDKLARDLKE
eukprot:316750-Chlamydomonas_euryale.AAC.1